MQTYFLTILLKNNLEDKKRGEVLASLKDRVEKDEGKILKEDLWGSKNLAYPIKHNEKAYYAYYEFEADPSKISLLDKNIKLNEDVIRYLLIRK